MACYFMPSDSGGHPDHWTRMANVLAYSAALNCPGFEIAMEQLGKARPVPGRTESVAANTWKLDRWAEVVAAAAEGDEIVLIDVDTFILRDLAPAFDRPFDVAYTLRDSVPPVALPFNAGVVFIRANDASRRFMRMWRDENRRMAADPAYHLPWFKRYGGINQAALGKILAEDLPASVEIRVESLPCSEWNCEDSTWARFDPAVTRVVHVKSALRRDVFNLSPAVPGLRHLTRLWRELERDAMRAGGALR